MSTEKPKLQGYIIPELHERYIEWKKEKGITKDSEALNLLLSQFFDMPVDPIAGGLSANVRLTERRVEELINKTTAQKFEELEAKINSLTSHVLALSQAQMSNTRITPIVPTPEIPKPQGEPDLWQTQAELSRRLKCGEGTLKKNREKPNFIQWAMGKDPDKHQWVWDEEEKMYKGYLLK